MLRSTYEPTLRDQDHEIFATLVPADHYLRQVAAVVDFERYRPFMAERYHPSDGRPANDHLADEERLLQRVTHLRQMVAWADRLCEALEVLPPQPQTAQAAFVDAVTLSHKLLMQLLASADPQCRTRLLPGRTSGTTACFVATGRRSDRPAVCSISAGAWLSDPAACSVDPGAWITKTAPRIADPGSWIINTGSWFQTPRRSVPTCACPPRRPRRPASASARRSSPG